jgi:succinate dehydrogenase / fumarate reductase membrane anchor subunit
MVTILLLLAMFYHMALGIQVVIEDYVHTEWVKMTALLLNNFVAVVLAVTGIFAVLRIAFQG